MAHGLPDDQRSWLGLQDLDTCLKKLALVLPSENVEYHCKVDEVYTALQLLQRAVRIKDVGLDEACLECLLVTKEIVSQIDEVSQELGAVEVLRGCSVGDKLSDVLSKAATNVEILGPSLKSPDYQGV